MRAVVIPVLVAIAAHAPQSGPPSWKEIGRTASNSIVLVDTKSIRRMNDSVTVTMRTRFEKPDGEKITGTRTIATFNCSKALVAVKENDSYIGTRVVKRSIPARPGYGVVFGGSLTGIAYAYLCPGSKKP